MRVKANYTIDEDIKNEFDTFCKENHINKSSLVEEFMVRWLKRQKNENDKK